MLSYDSYHVWKGDSIDLLLPSPEEWIDTIAYAPTGTADLTTTMKENDLFLAGTILEFWACPGGSRDSDPIRNSL